MAKDENKKESKKTEKDLKPKDAPQKSMEKKKPVKKAVIKPMVHIDDFIGLATEIYDMNSMQQAGFKAYMTGKQYLTDTEAFIPYLERYLGK